MSNSLVVKNLNYVVNKIKILSDVSFQLPSAKIAALIGKNGAGKTTLIKCILDLIKNYKGDILINGINARKPLARLNITYIPEKEDLPNSSILSFLIQQASYYGMNKQAAIKKIRYLCKTLDFPFIRTKMRIKTLSSGLRKIIMIMQAFLIESTLVIADEPTANLDFDTRILFYKSVKTMVKKYKTTFLISTHDLFEIKQFANHFLFIKHGRFAKADSYFSIRTE